MGMRARVAELVLPGSELEALPLERATPLVLRITRVAPHGSALRYDFELCGLEPGTYDLRAFLRRKDGSSLEDLPELGFDVRSVLPEGQVRPHAPRAGARSSFGGYTALVWVGGALWTIGLVLLLAAGRQRRARAREALRPRTLAEHLEPLVTRALQGELSRAERAALELSLVAFWRRKLGLCARRPEEVLPLLRSHPDAGPLLTSLEAWLHRPESAQAVDVVALLAPYRNLPSDALSETARPAVQA